MNDGKNKRSCDRGEKDRIMQGGVGGLNVCGQIRFLSLLPDGANCFSFDNSGRGFAEILHLSKNNYFPIWVRRVIRGGSDADPSSFINFKIMMSVFPLKEGNNCNDNPRGYCDIFEDLLPHDFGIDSTMTSGVENVVADCAEHGVYERPTDDVVCNPMNGAGDGEPTSLILSRTAPMPD